MCADILIPLGLIFNMIGVIILVSPYIRVKQFGHYPSEKSPVTIFREAGRPTSILGLSFIFIGFLLQLIAQFL